MLNYGTARHLRKKQPKNVQSSSAKGSLPILIQWLQRFVVGSILASVTVYILFFMVAPLFVVPKTAQNIVLINQNSNEQAAYFIHFNPDETVQLALVLPDIEHISPQTASLSQAFQEVVSEVVVLPVTDQSHRYLVDLFDVRLIFDKEISVSTKQQLLKYYLYASRNKKTTLTQIETFSDIAKKTGDKQNIWKYEKARACPIAIVNATQTQGLAQRYTTIIENSGGFAIRVANDTSLKEKSSIVMRPNSPCESVATELVKIFNPSIEITKAEDSNQEYRSEIIVYIGADGVIATQ